MKFLIGWLATETTHLLVLLILLTIIIIKDGEPLDRWLRSEGAKVIIRGKRKTIKVWPVQCILGGVGGEMY